MHMIGIGVMHIQALGVKCHGVIENGLKQINLLESHVLL